MAQTSKSRDKLCKLGGLWGEWQQHTKGWQNLGLLRWAVAHVLQAQNSGANQQDRGLDPEYNVLSQVGDTFNRKTLMF